jgi:hypothetical protein
MPDGTLQAPQLWEGTCNADIFNNWLEYQLTPHLKPHHVVIMDNAVFQMSLPLPLQQNQQNKIVNLWF